MLETLVKFKYVLILEKNQIVLHTFWDSKIDDRMDQVLIQVICSMERSSGKLVRLSRIMFMMNHYHERCVQIRFRLYNKDLKIMMYTMHMMQMEESK